MVRRGRGAQRRHRLGDAELEQRDHVHVALDHDQPLDLLVGLAHLPQAVQLAALVEQRGLRRVQVLGAVVLVEHAAAEGDDPAAAVEDREHHPVAELVVDVAAVVLGEQPGAVEQLEPALVGAQRVLERAVAVRGVADLEARAVFGVHAAAVQVDARLLAAVELALEELGRRFQRGVQVAMVVAGGLGRATLLGVARDVHAGALGQLVDRVEEFEAVVVHQEADRGAVRAAAEAVVELLGWRHRERGRAFVVERAARRVLLALALQRHARADHLDDVGACEQVVDECVGDAGHPHRMPRACAVTLAARPACGSAPCGQGAGGACAALRGSIPAATSLLCERRRSSITAVISAPTKNTTVA
ncbi:hypothetical protein NB706_002866 [Xanthomonas sacchari]|nr:hypothetical protein [Xanthomonas sacchari]